MEKMKINPKEQQVLNILWKKNVPVTAKQICEIDTTLVMSTVQVTLKKLMNKGLAKVSDIVYSGTVLTRSYTFSISKEEFILNQFEDIKLTELISQFLGSRAKNDEVEEIKAIEDLIRSKKKELE
ncbi:BlaI/MecI/CopY family transcriptional regulator [Enterococcus sp. BWB1-3]|uniref:BlaI/MecI/CopY family transcriptional regulator n=1 Tax=unclassified Enterococcus TaxID=2608891 RepID=UPI001920B79A|nr:MULTISPECIES: BlaI/MecI/CopY family transcriptional regulator [unclassified Enterococcus]MBL1229972.1 BlaI/MecI/CopY family transcriptional regulator [Enterococcus sp. BWB1-3]MCB5952969.1 BlaI/MecI/CopY family transcriptional regulator [Enterococcus sp. BWT-B8]